MRIWKIALCVGLLSIPGMAGASQQSDGYITQIEVTQDRVFLYFDSARTAAPSCSCCNRWELTTSTPAGQAQLSIALSAYAMHKKVFIAGTGDCVAGSYDTEGVLLLRIPPG